VLTRVFTAIDRTASSPALFLDRDGVLNQRIEHGYVIEVSMLKVLDTTIPAIRLANQMGLPVVVVTNQGAVARRLLTVSTLDRIHDSLRNALAEQHARVDGIYTCPHHPAAIAISDRTCMCRKPSPALLLKAAADMRIDLPMSVMVGDQPSDQTAAVAAGLPSERVVIMDDRSTPDGVRERVQALLGNRAA
jgi:D-glycero-D-manno-heptose 1,7-bisphosphate phosphatase